MKDWEYDYIREQLSWGRSVADLVDEGYDEEVVAEEYDNWRDSMDYFDAVDWAWNHR